MPRNLWGDFMTKRLVLATNNANKVREIQQILGGAYDEVVSLRDLGLDIRVVEDGETFRENAAKKAIEISRQVDGDVLADDSGLVVEALDGAPGVRSARFAGENANDAANNEKLLSAMQGKTDRRARFVCAMAIARNGEIVRQVEGTVEGEIAPAPKGEGGFGYDSLFFFPQENMTFAELSHERKNEVSHRANALRELNCQLS